MAGLKHTITIVLLDERFTGHLYTCSAFALVWICWYLWLFFVSPTLYPQEPRQLPYLVPWLGHTISFARCAENVYKRGKKHFNSFEPYGITLAGKTTVIIQNVSDLAQVWKNTKDLSYDPFVGRMLLAFGIPEEALQRLFHPDPASLVAEANRHSSLLVMDNPKKKCYIHLQSDWFKRQLLPGDNLTQLQNDYLKHLVGILTVDNFQPHFVTHVKLTGATRETTVSLGKLTRYTLSHCAFRAFFGEKLFEIEPKLTQTYQKWEDDSWKVFYNYPYLLAMDLHQARIRATESLAKYYDLPPSERSSCWIFSCMDAEIGYLGLKRSDRAGIIMMICWAINNNAHYINSWMLLHILITPGLLEIVREETDACCNTNGSSCFPEKLLERCPTLDAIWNECLRLYNASTTVRQTTRDFYIGNKMVCAGTQIFGPARNWQLSENFFGANPDRFDHTRWLQNKGLARSKGFTPFGGGQTYCPGRYFAQGETYMFIAILLRRFELRVSTSDGKTIDHPKVPIVEINLPAPAAMRPVNDTFVTVTERI